MLSWSKMSSPMRSPIYAVTMSSVMMRGAVEGVGIFTLIVPIIGKHPSSNRNMFFVGD